MYYKIYSLVVLSSLFLILIFCNSPYTDAVTNKRKPILLYFNPNDTITYKKHPGLLRLKDPHADSLIATYYRKSEVQHSDVKRTNYRIGPGHLYIHVASNPKHTKHYLPKDSLDNYEIVKVPWKEFNVKILDLSNQDSAFIVTVDYLDIQE